MCVRTGWGQVTHNVCAHYDCDCKQSILMKTENEDRIYQNENRYMLRCQDLKYYFLRFLDFQLCTIFITEKFRERGVKEGEGQRHKRSCPFQAPGTLAQPVSCRRPWPGSRGGKSEAPPLSRCLLPSRSEPTVLKGERKKNGSQRRALCRHELIPKDPFRIPCKSGIAGTTTAALK